jgi:hypothetical protein
VDKPVDKPVDNFRRNFSWISYSQVYSSYPQARSTYPQTYPQAVGVMLVTAIAVKIAALSGKLLRFEFIGQAEKAVGVGIWEFRPLQLQSRYAVGKVSTSLS